MESHEHKHGPHHEHHRSSGHSPDIQKELKTQLSGAAETFKDLKSGGKFNMGKEFKNAFEILKLNSKKMDEVADNKAATLPALIFISIGALAFHIGLYLMIANVYRGLSGLAGLAGMGSISYTPPIFSLLISFVLLVAVTIVGIFVLDFVANTFFKGHGKFGQLFRVLGYANLVMIVSIFMQIAFLGSIWLLVVTYYALTKIKKLNATNAVFTIIISVIALAVISYLLNLLFVTLGMGGMFSMYNPEYYSMMRMY